jgi:hypothetical protein
MWDPTSLGSPTTLALLFAAHTSSLSGWFHLLPVAFLCRYFIFLESPIAWGLHCSLGITLTASHSTPGAPCRDPDPTTIAWPPRLQKLEANLHDHVTCILHAYKTNIMWMKPHSAANSNNSQPGTMDVPATWVPAELNAGKHFLMCFCTCSST